MSSPIRILSAFLLILSAATLVVAQAPSVGDYGSVASGNWGTTTTWRMFSFNGQAFDSTVSVAPTSSKNVWILRGTTVTVEASGKNCLNLVIDTNAVLLSGVALPTSSIVYVNVYGTSVVVNGTLGTIAGDALSLTFYSSATMSGTGTVRPARLRPGTNVKNTTITFDCDLMPMYNGGTGTGGTAVYPLNSGNDTITFTLNAGRTMTLPTYANIGTTTTSTSDGNIACTFNINGTLIQTGPQGNFHPRVSAGRTCTVNIGTGGVISSANNMYASGAGTTIFNVASGGSLTFGTNGSGYGDFSSLNTTVTGGGTVTVPAGAEVRIGSPNGLNPATGPLQTTVRTYHPAARFNYLGTSAQVTGSDLPSSVARLTVNNAAGLTLTNSVTIDSSLVLTNGKLTGGAETLTMGPAATISGGSATSFVDGKFAHTLNAPGKFFFPIGQGSDFLPATAGFSAIVGSGTLALQVLDTAVTPISGPLDPSARYLRRYLRSTVGSGLTSLTADTVILSYSNADMVGFPYPKSALQTYSWGTQPAPAWFVWNQIANDTAANKVTVIYPEGGDEIIFAGPIPPPPTIAPRSFNFGPVSVGSSKADSFYVKNAGVSPLIVHSIAKTSPRYTVVPTTNTIAASDSAWFVVTFSPTSVATVTDTLIISHNGLNLTDTVRVGGAGVQAGIAIAPTTVAFGGVPTGQPKLDSVVVTNSGSGNLVIDSVVSSTPTVVVTPAAPVTILPATSSKFYLTFTPTGAGAMAGTVKFYHNAPSLKDSVVVNGTGVTGAFFTEDFTPTAGTLLTAMGYLVSSGTSNAIAVTSPGLSLANYTPSGVGNAATLLATGQDVYQAFPFRNTGSVYLSFMANVTSAGTGDYFIALSPSSSQTNYYGRLHLKSSGAGYVVGISKSNEVSGGAQYGSTVFSFGSTVVFVMKYTFVPADSNDLISVYAFNSTIPTTEPVTPEIANYSGSTRGDASNLGYVTLRQGGTGAAPVLVIDGIRIGTTWVVGVPTGIADAPIIVPRVFDLRNNYPNPFNPTTKIEFTVARDGDASLKVYNMLGQEVATLFNGPAQAGVLHTTTFDARSLPSGVYFSVLTSEGQRFVKKLMLLK